jgi:hypothetical protein
MAKLGISTGTTPNDGLGDNLLAGAGKINSNFSEIYTLFGDGTQLNSDWWNLEHLHLQVFILLRMLVSELQIQDLLWKLVQLAHQEQHSL